MSKSVFYTVASVSFGPFYIPQHNHGHDQTRIKHGRIGGDRVDVASTGGEVEKALRVRSLSVKGFYDRDTIELRSNKNWYSYGQF